MENGERVLGKFKIFTILSLFTVFCSLFTEVEAGIIDEIETKQKNINSVEAHFYQEKYTEILEKPIISKGIFYYRAPYNVRWEYSENSNLMVIYDGRALYLYYPDIKEAEKIDNLSRLPFFINFDISSLKKDYDIKHRVDKSESYTIVLMPKVSTPISSIEMVFTGDKVFPEELKIIEKTNDRTLIKFSDITINKTLSDDLFKFIPDASVKIRERSLR